MYEKKKKMKEDSEEWKAVVKMNMCYEMQCV
jgi:hypothetical protein